MQLFSIKGQDYGIGLKNSEVRLRHMIRIMNIINSEAQMTLSIS